MAASGDHRPRWALAAAGVFVLAAWSLLTVVFLLQRERSLNEGAQRLLHSQQRIAEGLDQVFLRAELRAAEVATVVRSGVMTRRQVLELFSAKLLHDGELVQFGIMLEPGNPVEGDDRFAVGVTFGAKGIQTEDFVANNFEYWLKPWYLQTRESVDGWWSAPYFNDAAGGQDTLTFDFPLRTADSGFYGMVSVSVSLERIVELAQSLGLKGDRELSEFVLIDANRRVLVSSNPAIERAYTVEAAAERTQSPLLQWLVGSDAHRNFQLHHDESRRMSVIRLPLQRVDWYLAAAVNDDLLLAALYRNSLVAAVSVLIIAALIALWVGRQSRRFVDQLDRLEAAAARLAEGELSEPIPLPPPSSLLRPIGGALEQSRAALSRHVGLERARRDQQQRDLGRNAFTRQLQAQSLPADRVFLGDQFQAQINAKLRPASHVAGDFYGFSTPAPGVCFFYLGQVQGQNADALLFMSRLNTAMPLILGDKQSPSEALQQVAEHLLQSPEQGWRVDLQLGRLDLNSGQLSVCNAGSPEPTLLRGQTQEAVAVTKGLPLSRDQTIVGATSSLQLQPGDRLLLFSDGLLSARQVDGEPFGQTRLQIAVEKQMDSPAELLIDSVLDEVVAFSQGNYQDDLAIMLLAMGYRD